MEKINPAANFGRITEHWRRGPVGDANGKESKLVESQGEFATRSVEPERLTAPDRARI
jgi:hypothetical protein